MDINDGKMLVNKGYTFMTISIYEWKNRANGVFFCLRHQFNVSLEQLMVLTFDVKRWLNLDEVRVIVWTDRNLLNKFMDIVSEIVENSWHWTKIVMYRNLTVNPMKAISIPIRFRIMSMNSICPQIVTEIFGGNVYSFTSQSFNFESINLRIKLKFRWEI